MQNFDFFLVSSAFTGKDKARLLRLARFMSCCGRYELKNEKRHYIGQNRHRQLSHCDPAKAPDQITLTDPFSVVAFASNSEGNPYQPKSQECKLVYHHRKPYIGCQKDRETAQQLSDKDHIKNS